jgi:hypothetical protein
MLAANMTASTEHTESIVAGSTRERPPRKRPAPEGGKMRFDLNELARFSYNPGLRQAGDGPRRENYAHLLSHKGCRTQSGAVSVQQVEA